MIRDLASGLHIKPTLLYTLIFAGLIVAALVVGFVLSRVFSAWARKLHNTWGEFVFALLATLPVPLLVLLALYIGMESLPLPRFYERIASKLIFALVILVVSYFPAKILLLFLARLSERHAGMKQVAQPAAFIIKALFALLAVVILLDNLGVSLTAVWTTLGVGSVAVALALQDTLGNAFAGLTILADRPFRLGDFIKLDSGQEGLVSRVGWRSTTLHTLGNNLVAVPNAMLAKAVITNYSEPEPALGFSLPVSVAYGTDPTRVEKALLDAVAQAVRDGVEGLPPDPRPSVRLNPGFGDSSLDFTLGVRIREFRDQYLVGSELRKRILERFAAEGIERPYPTRAVVLDKAALDALAKAQPKA
ncbi:MAG TPA: mechanosensitive ion channel family protein [Gemmatimonadaceae bacterium]|nr:MAG: hypothetical protein DMG21_11085 [Acidobacteriota bacterium]HTD84612.1 mechanosensitive ion channel family protein [Gemmatimonadaceae bacterium]